MIILASFFHDPIKRSWVGVSFRSRNYHATCARLIGRHGSWSILAGWRFFFKMCLGGHGKAQLRQGGKSLVCGSVVLCCVLITLLSPLLVTHPENKLHFTFSLSITVSVLHSTIDPIVKPSWSSRSLSSPLRALLLRRTVPPLILLPPLLEQPASSPHWQDWSQRVFSRLCPASRTSLCLRPPTLLSQRSTMLHWRHSLPTLVYSLPF